MTMPPGEAYPHPVEIVESPTQLSGLEPLEMGHSVQVARVGVEIPGVTSNAEDALSILVGEYEGRTAEGKPFPYVENPLVRGYRVMDISALPVTATANGSTVPVKPNFMSLHWEATADGRRMQPVFAPLLPGAEYAAKNDEGLTAATYSIDETGALTVTRSADMPEQAGDVRVVGDTPNPETYVPRPALGAVAPETVVTQGAVVMGRGDARIDERDGHLFVTPGRFESTDAAGNPITVTFQERFVVPLGAPGVFEGYTAHIVAASERKRTDGVPTVADFTTIGKEDDNGGGPIIVDPPTV